MENRSRFEIDNLHRSGVNTGKTSSSVSIMSKVRSPSLAESVEDEYGKCDVGVEIQDAESEKRKQNTVTDLQKNV